MKDEIETLKDAHNSLSDKLHTRKIKEAGMSKHNLTLQLYPNATQQDYAVYKKRTKMLEKAKENLLNAIKFMRYFEKL